MSRVQLAINVADVDVAVDFYAKLFDTPPAKRRPGYANFAIADPPLKLVLIESSGAGGTLNHLGVEVESADLVAAAHSRLATGGVATALEQGVDCCYAVQDKVWVNDADGAPWEIYTVMADSDTAGADLGQVEVCGPAGCASSPVPADPGGPPVRACC